MRRTHLISIVAGLLVLMASSAWLGATVALWRTATREPGPLAGPPPMMLLANHLDRLERLSGLTDGQRERLSPAIERARREIRDLARDTHGHATEIRRRLRAELEGILTPDQRAELHRRGNGRPRFMDRGRGAPFFSAPTNESREQPPP